MVARCRSNCATNKSVASCNSADKCSYTNGAVRRYCRLSSKFKMNKPDCNITRKFLKKEKGPAEKIRRFLERKHASRKRNRINSKLASSKKMSLDVRDIMPHSPLVIAHNTKQGPTEEEIKKLTDKAHTRKIARFMGKLNPGKIRANRSRYLNGICSDAGVCLAFGPHAKKVKKHFGGFVHFDNVNYLRKIGAVSSNGFVKEIEYEHDGYKAHAVLKSSASADSDNLYYEYLVGNFINAVSRSLPNFVETYGLFKYNSNPEYQDMMKLNATKDALSGLSLIKTPPDSWNLITKTESLKERNEKLIQTACEESMFMSVLIQHIKEAKSLEDKCNSMYFVRYDLHFVLFQVYWALYTLNSNFTHYDLHTSNVMVYEPVNDSYIHYFYHLENGSVVSFKSKYIAKLIDYGRSYFDFQPPPDVKDQLDIYGESTDIYDAVCKEPKCEPKCGYNVGFSTLNSNYYKKYGIESRKSNISHDLRLLYMMKSTNKVILYNNSVIELCDKVVFNTMYGTPEVAVSGYPAKINNVVDAMWGLKDIVQNPSLVSQNDGFYGNMKKLGEMHIYEDQTPIEFIPAV